MLHTSLHSTRDLLKRAFPHGIGGDDRLGVIAHLYPHMAHGPIASVIAAVTGCDMGLVMNEVLVAGAGGSAVDEAFYRVAERLGAAGFDQWAKEEETEILP